VVFDRWMTLRWKSAAGLCAVLLTASCVVAQNGRPTPADPEKRQAESDPADNGASRPQPIERGKVADGDADATEQPSVGEVVPPGNGPRRADIPEGLVKIAFDDVSVDQTFDFISRYTGKVVIPIRPVTLRNTKITVVSEQPIPRTKALDMLFNTLRLNGIGIIENDDVIIIDQLNEIVRGGEMPLIPADQSIMHREDKGTIIVKIFRLQEADAEIVAEELGDSLPDYASLTVDPNSNQIVAVGDVGLCQHLQRLIDELDRNYALPVTQTYRLKYSDANEIANNIYDLFETDENAQGGRAGRTVGGRGRNGRRGGQANQSAQPTGGPPGPMIPLRVTVNVQQNTVTVKADRRVIDQISGLVQSQWDVPRPESTSKVYNLEYTDPLKVRDLLQTILGQGGGGGSAARGARQRAGGQGGGGRTDVSEVVGGIYNIEAYSDSNSIVVVSKTEQSLDFLDAIIEKIDRPTDIGMPVVVPLKHANAVELSEELNVLLSDAGSGLTLPRPQQGLSGQSIGDTGGGAGGAGGGAAPAGRQGDGQQNQIQFPWQQGGAAGGEGTEQSPPTSLVGKIRVVPVIRQNALSILCPPAFTDAVVNIVHQLDQPTRQVMISAVIAEVELGDDLELGLRFSSSDAISGDLPDFRLSGSGAIEGSEEDFLDNLFDTSVLDVNVSINALVQALQRETNIRILQEPRVFTADNQEAEFFDGQEVPVVENTQTTAEGTVNEQVQRVEVGVILNVRPRITAQGDVELEVFLELSSVSPQTGPDGGFIFDRRRTSTEVIIESGQTIVVSGILRDQESQIINKIPLLGDIPLLGELFKFRDQETRRSELVAFITPQVVERPDDNYTNYNAEELERLRQLTKPLREQKESLRDEPVRERMAPFRSEPTPTTRPTPDNHAGPSSQNNN